MYSVYCTYSSNHRNSSWKCTCRGAMRKGGIGVGGALVHTYTCSTTCMYIYVLWLFLFLFHVGSNGCTHFHVSADQLCLPTGNGSYSLTCTDHFNLDSNNNCRGTYVYYSYVYVHHLYCILKSSNTWNMQWWFWMIWIMWKNSKSLWLYKTKPLLDYLCLLSVAHTCTYEAFWTNYMSM